MNTQTNTTKGIAIAVAFQLLMGCGSGSSGPQSRLAYLSDQKGKFPKREGVLESQPLQERLQALLQSRYEGFLKNWDAEGPLDPKENVLFASACVSRFCDQYGSAFHIDYREDELVALIRTKETVEVFRESAMGIKDLPAMVQEWIGKGHAVLGDVGPKEAGPESSGTFQWKSWTDAPEEWKQELKGIEANRKQTVFEQAAQADAMDCEVRMARYDLDGDGTPGIILTYQCEFWCGQAGCAFNVYEGNQRIKLTDVVDEVRPGDGGVISSKGVLLKLK